MGLLDIFSVFMVLFAVIDIFGSLPIIVDIKNKGTVIKPFKITLISLAVLTAFFFIGEGLLGIFGVDISSFAIAGSFVIFFLALEMVLNIEIFKGQNMNESTIVPIVFPLIAGAGSITTLLSLRAEYATLDIMIALVLNMVVVFFVLKLTRVIEKLLGQSGIAILRKIFGIILLAIAVKLFMSNVAISIGIHFPGLLN